MGFAVVDLVRVWYGILDDPAESQMLLDDRRLVGVKHPDDLGLELFRHDERFSPVRVARAVALSGSSNRAITRSKCHRGSLVANVRSSK